MFSLSFWKFFVFVYVMHMYISYPVSAHLHIYMLSWVEKFFGNEPLKFEFHFTMNTSCD